jgi:hypothetical protein
MTLNMSFPKIDLADQRKAAFGLRQRDVSDPSGNKQRRDKKGGKVWQCWVTVAKARLFHELKDWRQ